MTLEIVVLIHYKKGTDIQYIFIVYQFLCIYTSKCEIGNTLKTIFPTTSFL